MSGYWPWWVGAPALATVTFGYWRTVGRTLGASTAWDRVLHWREERAVEQLDAAFDDAGFEAALSAATAEAFGSATVAVATRAVAPSVIEAAPDAPAAAAAPATDADAAPAPAPPVPVAAHAALLASIFVGGLIAAVVSGRFEVRLDMGPDFASLVAGGWRMWPTLFLGGVLAGFGTRLAGGCSSGHGLSGCSRLQPASLVATAAFFGTAVAVSFLLWDVL